MCRALQCQSRATPSRTWNQNSQTYLTLNIAAGRSSCFNQQLPRPCVQQRHPVHQQQNAAKTSDMIRNRSWGAFVCLCAVSSNGVAVAAGGLWDQLLQLGQVLLSMLSAIPWYALGAVLLAGLALGLAISKAVSAYVQRELDPDRTSRENAELRAKVEDLQQLMMKLEPLAYKSMKLRFTKGINKAVILGMVDTMLANKEVNIWWLPDQVERIIYFNMMTLMLSVLDEIVDGMSISFAGHNVRLQLTYLDVDSSTGQGPSPAITATT